MTHYFSAWNSVKNVRGFSTIDGTPVLTTPLPAPSMLPTSGVAVAQPETLDYYVRFTSFDGTNTTLTLDGNQFFALQAFTFGATQTLNIGSQSSGAGAGKVAFDTLKLSLGDAALNPGLFARLASGTPFKEVDVLGYRLRRRARQQRQFRPAGRGQPHHRSKRHGAIFRPIRVGRTAV